MTIRLIRKKNMPFDMKTTEIEALQVQAMEFQGVPANHQKDKMMQGMIQVCRGFRGIPALLIS